MVAESVGLRRRARPRGRLRRRALLRRLRRATATTPWPRCAPPARPAPARSSCATRTAARLTDELSGSSATRSTRSAPIRRAPAITWGIHTHNDAELAVANSLAAVEAGVRHVQATINGYGERCGNANMVSILANLALKTELDLAAGRRRPPGRPDRPVAGRGRDRQRRPQRPPALRRPLGLRPQGRRPRRRRGQGRAAATSTSTRRSVGNESRLVVSELGGRANTQIRAEQLGHRLDGSIDARELSRPDQAARGRRAGLRGRRGLVRAADPAPRARLRRALPDRRLHRPRRAARRRRAAAPRRRSRSRSPARCSTRRPTATARSMPSTPPCARRSARSTRSSTRST